MSRGRNWRIISSGVALALGIQALTFLGAPRADAGFQVWTFNRAKRATGKGSDIRFGFAGGGRMMFHYNRARVTSTPPESWLGEVQLSAWYRDRAMFFVSYGRSVSQATSQFYGGGMKVPFVGVEPSVGGIFGGVTLALVADFGQYTLDPSAAPFVYPSSYSLFRYGGSIHLGLAGAAVYLDGTLMVTNVNDNLFVAPFAGLGFRF